jgi:hypothetical protein
MLENIQVSSSILFQKADIFYLNLYSIRFQTLLNFFGERVLTTKTEY